MFKDKPDELDMMVLKKRIDLLTTQGVVARMPLELKQDFLGLMGDKWLFDGIVSTIHGMQEIHDPKRDDAAGETLPTPKKKRDRKSTKELAKLSMWEDPFEDENLTFR